MNLTKEYPMKKAYTLLLALILGSAIATAQQQVTIRVCTYNIYNFGPTALDRAGAIYQVLSAIHPDILVLHEVEGAAGYGTLQTLYASQPSSYAIGPFTDGPDTDNAIVYDTTKVEFVDHLTTSTPLRNIDDWVIRVKGRADLMHVVGCHLKAGDMKEDAAQRAVEAGILANTLKILSSSNQFVLAGDLNLYGSSEPAYDSLIAPVGVFVDPINRPGDWHDNSDFGYLHTQSPRVRQFGGGIGGGLDDRFDFVLLS